MGFETIDYIIVVTYLAGIALFGILAGGKQNSARDYFLGNKNIPWWAVCFAVVATETSTLTFISIPGVAYVSNLNFFQITFGYLLGRMVIAYLFLPAYFRGDITTAYALIGERFGPSLRTTTSLVFMGTRLLADGVRLYATAIPIKLITGVDYLTAISVIAAVTLVYTYIGGVRSVVWMDVVQMFIYLGGAIAAMAVLNQQISDLPAAVAATKWNVIRTGFDLDLATFFSTPYTLFASILGGAFLSMASHGTDQLIVGRLLTTNSLSASRKAIVVSGFIVMLQFAMFLFIGLQLYAFYGGEDMDPNEVFPQYIIHHIPSGVSGLIIAGLLAAAMSTIAGSVNALASSTMFDLFRAYNRRLITDRGEMLLSRLFTLFWCGLLVLSAVYFINTSKTVVELALGIASFTYGGLLGTFILAIVFPSVGWKAALTGFVGGVAVMAFVIYGTQIAWTWHTVIGTLFTVGIGRAAGIFFPTQFT